MCVMRCTRVSMYTRAYIYVRASVCEGRDSDGGGGRDVDSSNVPMYIYISLSHSRSARYRTSGLQVEPVNSRGGRG